MMRQENMEQQPTPEKTRSLKERMAAQQQQPGSPPSAYVPAPALAPNPPAQQSSPAQRTEATSTRSEKMAVRATHFVDDNGIAWTRTGLTIPAAYWRGIVAYTNQAKLQWQPGQEKTTQQQLIVEAIGTWLNDHRSDLPASVNAECDQVRKTLR